MTFEQTTAPETNTSQPEASTTAHHHRAIFRQNTLNHPASLGKKNGKASALILGGGFAGLEMAIELSKRGLRTTLVSDREEMFIYPTSIWMVTGDHVRADDVISLRDAAKKYGFEFVAGQVTEIRPNQKSAVINGVEQSADYLVLATGAGRFQIAGMAHTHTVWGAPEDTEALHEALEKLLTKGSGHIALGFGGNPKDPSAVRGGPLFEVIFNIHHMLKKRNLRDHFKLTFFAPMMQPGNRMGEKAATAVNNMLDNIDVSRMVGKKIVGFDEHGVQFEGDVRLDADLTIFIPAGAGHPMVATAPLPLNDAGFVIIDGQCRVAGFDNVFAVGDVAAIEGPEWRAKQGHLTVAMAKVASAAIIKSEQQKGRIQDYRNHVNILCIMDTGTGAAIVKRTTNGASVTFLPVVGHILKKAWGWYYRLTHSRWFRRAESV